MEDDTDFNLQGNPYDFNDLEREFGQQSSAQSFAGEFSLIDYERSSAGEIAPWDVCADEEAW